MAAWLVVAFLVGTSASVSQAAAASSSKATATVEITAVVPAMCAISQGLPSLYEGVDRNTFVMDVRRNCNTPHSVVLHYDPMAIPPRADMRVDWGEFSFPLDLGGAVELQRVDGIYRGEQSLRIAASNMMGSAWDRFAESLKVHVTPSR